MLPEEGVIQNHGDGIHVIDTGFHRPRFDACYLLVDEGRGAFIDTGPNAALPRLLSALNVAGLQPAEVDWVIVTHVHLDHAGGAGLLMQRLPQAKLVVHPRGARHLIDPGKLLDGARAVYGAEAVAQTYGDVVAVPESRVISTHDAMTLPSNRRPLLFLDTPGHARHHHCIWDERSRSFFTGDTFGLSYREFDTARGPWLLPTTTPVQFDPDALRASVQRLLAFDPQWMFLTHFGPVGQARALGAQLLEQIDEMVELGRSNQETAQRHDALKQGLARLYLQRVRAQGCAMPEERVLELLAMDIELNAQGLGIWLDRVDTR
jgi:glyoxylase-like metal-dependent hydrolase (beta-lactamase superfamily II)